MKETDVILTVISVCLILGTIFIIDSCAREKEKKSDEGYFVCLENPEENKDTVIYFHALTKDNVPVKAEIHTVKKYVTIRMIEIKSLVNVVLFKDLIKNKTIMDFISPDSNYLQQEEFLDSLIKAKEDAVIELKRQKELREKLLKNK